MATTGQTSSQPAPFSARAIATAVTGAPLRVDRSAALGEFHEYSVEWQGADLVYSVDGEEVHRNSGHGDNYPEPMFAILNFAKITDSPMEGEWVLEVDWVKHESWLE